mmetsp:Transcript_1402/g.3489  ORF Transcript_1402/g.3489 Transcript_1402/m.3489 type:complete len:214 (-) Transcript_1402:38-679(-)
MVFIVLPFNRDVAVTSARITLKPPLLMAWLLPWTKVKSRLFITDQISSKSGRTASMTSHLQIEIEREPMTEASECRRVRFNWRRPLEMSSNKPGRSRASTPTITKPCSDVTTTLWALYCRGRWRPRIRLSLNKNWSSSCVGSSRATPRIMSIIRVILLDRSASSACNKDSFVRPTSIMGRIPTSRLLSAKSSSSPSTTVSNWVLECRSLISCL